jgi:hypothetical protein
MFVQMCIKGLCGITRDQAWAIATRRGLACAWWRSAQKISAAEISERLTPEELDLHVNSFDEQHPARGGMVREESPFISLTAGSVERRAFLAQNEVHPAHEVAMNFATNFGQLRGECFLFYCWVLVGLRPNLAVRHLAEEVRELNTFTAYSRFQPEGEIVAKIEVPACQIEKFEHYEYSEDAKGRVRIRQLGSHSNPNYIAPHEVTNLRERL